jgi:hypothetical protein
LQWQVSAYFMDIRYILWQCGKFYGYLEFFPVLVCCANQKILAALPWRFRLPTCHQRDWSYGSWDRIPEGYRGHFLHYGLPPGVKFAPRGELVP